MTPLQYRSTAKWRPGGGPQRARPRLSLAPSARNPLANTVSESEPNDQSDCNLQHWEWRQLRRLHSTPRELRGGTDPPLRQTIKSQLTYVNLTDASFKRTLVIIAKECCEKGTPSLAGRTPFRNLRKLDWCEGRLLGTVKRRPPIPTVFKSDALASPNGVPWIAIKVFALAASGRQIKDQNGATR